MKKIILSIMTLLAATASVAQHGKYVGGDISMLPAYEASSTIYLDSKGNSIDDLLLWLTDECGWNSFRVRLFVDPKDTNHEGVIQDLDYVKKLGKRIKDAGAMFMLDIHYSDTWVDAGHIQSPAAWKNLSKAQKAEKMYSYTKETLEALVAYGAKPDLVQVGNEIMYGLCDIKVHPYDANGDDWDAYLSLLRNGCSAVREVCPEAEIIIHTDRPANVEYNRYYYNRLIEGEVDFDVIGLSFYPFWHGYLDAHPEVWNDGLENALAKLAEDFPTKKVQIVETAYNFQYWPNEGVNYDTRDTWTCSPEGQYSFMADLVSSLGGYANVDGLFYWFPEEAGCGDAANWNTYDGVVIKNWLNRGLWWSENSNGHWPITTSAGDIPHLMRQFLAPEDTGISHITTQKTGNVYNIAGQKVDSSFKGTVISNGRKYYRK